MNRKDERYKKDGVRSFGLTLVCLIVLVSLSACSRSAQIVTPPPTSTIRPTQMAATATAAPASTPTLQPLPDYQPVIDRALDFFDSQYNAELGLLRESPETAPECYWLATDNLLASYALDAIGEPGADDLRTSMAGYADVNHGMIESLVGEEIDWPPYDAEPLMITAPLEASAEISLCRAVTVKTETRDETLSQGWDGYADLVLYGALNAYNANDIAGAQSLYADAMAHYDDFGFGDDAYNNETFEIQRKDGGRQTVHLYATYKLALALIVGERIGHPLDRGILAALLDKQDPVTGGFTSLYHVSEGPQGDANTETTSYALLALGELMQE